MLNERNLLVKEMIKSEVFSENVKYEKMYSNLIKKDGSLRVKLYNISKDYKVMEKIKEKIESLAIGEVKILNSPNAFHPINSIVVYVKSENII